MKPVKEIEDLMLKASHISEGTTKENSFAFRGQTFKKKNLQEGYTLLFNEREALFNDSFKEWDTSFCSFYYALAKKENKDTELKKLYEQHAELSKIYKASVAAKNTIINELNVLQSKEVTQGQVNTFGHKANDYVFALNDELLKLDESNFVPLPNIDTIEELKESIIEGGEFKKRNRAYF